MAQADKELSELHGAMFLAHLHLAARYSATHAVRHAVAASSAEVRAELTVSQVAFAMGFSKLPHEQELRICKCRGGRSDRRGRGWWLNFTSPVLMLPNPFRPLPFLPASLPTIVSLAQAAYEERQLPFRRPRARLASPSCPTPSKKPAATTPTSSTTCDRRGRTSGAAGL